MEWNNRGGQNGQPTAQQPIAHAAPVAANPAARKTKKFNEPGWLRGLFVALLFSSVILAVAAIAYGAVGTGKSEASYVDDKQMQAVFLNGGQVYFGHIKSLNNEYLRMDGIYYLRVNQQVQPNQAAATESQNANDISLVKLGCELHGPQDQMVINREQVIFWENLKQGGQVAKAVEEYVKQNPGEQKCDQASGQSTTPTTDNQATTPTTTTPTTTTPKKP